MSTTTPQSSAWPRRRLQLRSVISSVLPIGWTWAAVTALIPYFWADHGPGTSDLAVLGLSRATWMSLHVWSSIAMGVITIAHLVLNRRGVGRSYKMLAGRPNAGAGRVPEGMRPAPRRSWAWVPATATAAIVVAGGFWFATVDGSHDNSTENERGWGVIDDPDHETDIDHEIGEGGEGGEGGGGYRGGRGLGG